MGFEPQKLYIGLVDFFAVILTGALATFLLADSVGPRLIGSRYDALNGTTGGLAFAFASYLVGHFIFLAGSFLLDEHVYDRVRSATPQGNKRRLAEGKRERARVMRLLSRICQAPTADNAVLVAENLRIEELAPLNAAESLNAFQWVKAKLTLHHPNALVAVQRFEADSKFFRSLTVVLLGVAIWGAGTGRFAAGAWALLLAAAAFIRYVEQRVKATRQAYWFAIMLAAEDLS